MGNLRFAAAILFVAACGNDHAQTVDAMPDTKMVDAKVWMDAPPPTYDFSCYQKTPGTAVDAMITVTGTAGEISQGGFSGVGEVSVSAYLVNSNTAADTDTSTSTGDFTLGPITTGGDAVDYLRGLDAKTSPTYRTTYLYPPNPIRATFDGIPVPMIEQALVNQLGMFLGAQDDTNNGMLFVAVNDCSTTMPAGIDGASITVQQNNQDVGDAPFDLGTLAPQAAGTFIVLNVPDGATEVSASYDGMTFPTHTVMVHKKPNGGGSMGTITATAVPPGPIN
jgi:hypothetical protein